jgi:hypothetical protein
MDSYLSKVKKSEEKVKRPVVAEEKMKKEDAEEFREEEESYMAGRKSVIQKFMDFIAGTEETEEEKKPDVNKVEEGEDEKELEKYDKKNKGILTSVKEFFSREDNDEPKEQKIEESKSSLPEDIKEILRIQNKWLMMLPGRTIREFKESDDYRVYKETLQKYGLIKVK